MKYSMTIQWSDQDQVYVVSLPGWEGMATNPITHGTAYEEAVHNGKIARDQLIETAQEHRWTLPEPRTVPIA